MGLVSPYTSNTVSPAPPQNAAIKIAQPGYNANTAPDFGLVFNSNWPSLSVVFTYTGTLPATYQTITIPHKLGYPPFGRAFYLDSNKNLIVNDGSFYDYYGVDENNFYLYYDGFSTAIYFYVILYNVDLSEDIDYPLLTGSANRTPYNPNVGIKIAKQNQNVTSRDPRNFILHSKYRAPLIKAVKTQQTSSSANPNVVQYVNTDNISTWNFGFVKSLTGVYLYAPYYAQSYPITRTDGITSYLFFITPVSSGATLVILRDPLLAPIVNEVTY